MPLNKNASKQFVLKSIDEYKNPTHNICPPSSPQFGTPCSTAAKRKGGMTGAAKGMMSVMLLLTLPHLFQQPRTRLNYDIIVFCIQQTRSRCSGEVNESGEEVHCSEERRRRRRRRMMMMMNLLHEFSNNKQTRDAGPLAINDTNRHSKLAARATCSNSMLQSILLIRQTVNSRHL